MATLAAALVVLVVAIHIYIVALEMFLWRTPRGMRSFGTDQAFADRSAPLAANQGLYNGFLVAGLVWGPSSRPVDSEATDLVRRGPDPVLERLSSTPMRHLVARRS